MRFLRFLHKTNIFLRFLHKPQSIFKRFFEKAYTFSEVHILDSIDGYIKAAEYTYKNLASEIFNLNSKPNNQYNVEALIKIYLEIWESEVDLVIDANNNLAESGILRLDASKARKILNWQPKYKFKEMMHEMVDYWLEKLK